MQQKYKKINHKLEALCSHISTTYNIPFNDIVVSAIGLDDDNYWRWICLPSSDGCSNITELLRNSKFLISGDDIAYYYCNDKNKAIKDNKYFPDQKDISVDCIGSFILWEVTNKSETTNNNAEIDLPRKTIVCVSTYGVKIIDALDDSKIIECYSDITNAFMRCNIFE